MKQATLDTAAMASSNVTYGGAVTTAGGGALMFMGQTITQVEIALYSMILGVVIGLAGLISNIIFKYLAHKEQCRLNKVIEKAGSVKSQ